MMGNKVSIKEASRILGVSAGTLRRWEQEGRIVAERSLGGHRRYDLAMIQQLAGLIHGTQEVKHGAEDQRVPRVAQEVADHAPWVVACAINEDDRVRLNEYCAHRGWTPRYLSAIHDIIQCMIKDRPQGLVLRTLGSLGPLKDVYLVLMLCEHLHIEVVVLN